MLLLKCDWKSCNHFNLLKWLQNLFFFLKKLGLVKKFFHLFHLKIDLNINLLTSTVFVATADSI